MLRYTRTHACAKSNDTLKSKPLMSNSYQSISSEVISCISCYHYNSSSIFFVFPTNLLPREITKMPLINTNPLKPQVGIINSPSKLFGIKSARLPDRHKHRLHLFVTFLKNYIYINKSFERNSNLQDLQQKRNAISVANREMRCCLNIP